MAEYDASDKAVHGKLEDHLADHKEGHKWWLGIWAAIMILWLERAFDYFWRGGVR